MSGARLNSRRTAASSGPLRIVAIGGGTGLSALLRGLKAYASHAGGKPPERQPPIDITAVVTVADDGGSSGRLRREMGGLPPGDVRNCMVALSEDEALLSRLFQYRFEAGHGLKGHNFGNLFLAAMTRLTGDFSKAISFSSEVLASRGRIFPSTSANANLEAWLEDGSHVEGESKIGRSKSPIERVALRPRRCKPLSATLEAIAGADLICLGPGSLYTSVIPNLLVHGISAALRESQARKAYFVNLMWQPGETLKYKASDHVKALYRHARPGILDWVVVNTRPVTGTMRRRYAKVGVYPVRNDTPWIEELGVEVIERDLLERGTQVRHSPERVAAVAVELAGRSRVERTRERRLAAGS